MNDKYILVDREPVLEEDLGKWGKWLEENERHVADTAVEGLRVSTVFLGIDHSFGNGKPLLFETMIFPQDGFQEELYCDRYSTWEEAEEGHLKGIREAERLATRSDHQSEGAEG